MSFSLTTRQVLAREKTVTRRNGWTRARVGQVVQPIAKGQGLKKGERVEKIGGPIRFTRITLERLNTITADDVRREGFGEMLPAEFVAMYCRANGCDPDRMITRIEFEYLPAVATP